LSRKGLQKTKITKAKNTFEPGQKAKIPDMAHVKKEIWIKFRSFCGSA